MGIVAEIIACNSRKPLYGYKALVYSVIFVGFLSFIVWAHHMFLTGMGTKMAAFFQITTMIISIPSVVILTTLILSLWGGSIRFSVPMMFARPQPPQPLNVAISISAWLLGLSQIPFILNFFGSLFFGKKVNENPWAATTLEWTAPSPPPHGNFATAPHVYRGPYEYSVPGQKYDFLPQSAPEGR